ncbi:MAG: hypothetical protein EOP06_14815 [Proteobacteria bacterium]|nr:MAG: hypothetical protein EOP06_14815 [Pseudomonadota bacterium]
MRSLVGVIGVIFLSFFAGCALDPVKDRSERREVEETSVSFQSSLDKTTLNGSLVTVANPKGYVLFFVGSGKTDRDETAPAEATYSGKQEKLFKSLAYRFAAEGFGSLRYDKRGVINDQREVDRKVWITADRDHLIADATDAAKFLMEKTGVPVSNLIFLGHSEGTVIAVETAINLKTPIRGFILMGAMARSMKDMLHYQIVESPHAANSDERAKSESEYNEALKLIRESREDWAPDGKPMNWYRQFLKAPSNESRIVLVKTKIAIFQGQDDFNTPIDELDRFKRIRLENLTTKTYPGLGHSFSPNKQGKPTYGPMDPKVIQDIVDTMNRF